MEFSFDFLNTNLFCQFLSAQKILFYVKLLRWNSALIFEHKFVLMLIFFSDAYVSFFFWFLGAHFFQGVFNATWISPSVIFRWKFCDQQTTFSLFFKSFFFSFGCSCWVSTMICLSGCWREMKELVHNLLSSQNLDTSPEARTVWSKFSILLEVFWLISIHKWTKVPNRFWLRFWRLIGWFVLPKWQKNVNYKIINHK